MYILLFCQVGKCRQSMVVTNRKIKYYTVQIIQEQNSRNRKPPYFKLKCKKGQKLFVRDSGKREQKYF